MKLFFLLSCLLWLPGNIPAAPEPAAGKPPELFHNHQPEIFRQLGPALEQIDFAHINFDLLSAAVFHETNQRRIQEKLPPLSYEPKLRDAARMQAEIMAKRGSISHVNPEREDQKTPLDRIRLAGLDPAFSAENVATSFAVVYAEGTAFYTREEEGKKVMSLEPNGKAITAHTYVSFAAALLDSWMKSPPHRKNILSLEPRFLGTSCQPGPNDASLPIFYCAQVFYTPQTQAPPAK